MLDNLSVKQLTSIVFVVLLLVFGLGSMGKMVEFNDAGVYQVKQSVSGNLEVITTPGPYFQGWGTITSYNAAEMFELSKEDNDEPIKVRFSDGGTAMVSGSVQFVLPSDTESILKLHQYFKTPEALRVRVLRQVFLEAVQQTASLMKADESYSSRRSEFAALVEEQVKRGIFQTEAIELKEKDVDGNEFNDTNIVIKKNEKGERLIAKISSLIQYRIEVGQITIKDFDYDETIDALIQKKKEAEQQKVVSKANAERSKQDRISAESKAAADIAIAKGQEEVEKIKAVTQAQKAFEVAQLDRKRAEETAKSEIVKGEAEARINQLKVAAGLTPQEKAQFQMDTAVGVAKELASIKLPGMMIFGGGTNSPTDPFTAVGLESFMRISEKLNK